MKSDNYISNDFSFFKNIIITFYVLLKANLKLEII